MKKLGRQLGVLVLAMVLLLSFAACGTSAGAQSLADQPPVDLTMLLFTGGLNPPDLQKVQDQVAQIVKAKLNVNLSFKTVGFADFQQTIPLILSTGEQLDIFEPFTSYNTFLANGYLADITDFVNQYGQEMLEIDGDYIKMAMKDGKIFGVPSMKDLAQGAGLVMRKDLVDKYNIDLRTIKSYDDLTNIFRAIKQGENIAPLAANQPNGGVYVNPNLFDGLGIGFAGISDPANSTEIVNMYATPGYAQMLDYIRQWNNEGLCASDSVDTGANLLRAGRAFCYPIFTKPGIDTQESLNAGTPVVVWEASPALATTVNVWTWCVNANSKNPDRSVQLLNLLFTDKEINNLLAWGIKDEHYVFANETADIIKYPDGVDPNTVGYNLWTRFSLPNNFLQYVMQGNMPDLWAQTKVFNDTAVKSAGLGFSFDSSNVLNEMTAINNVVQEYSVSLETGVVDPKEKLPEFINALEQAGMNTVIAEAQKQFDAWLASSN